MRAFFLTLLISISCMTAATAQKYGHLNFGNLISQMPGTQAADSELEAYNTELTQKGEDMVNKLRERVAAVEGRAQDLPPIEMEKIRAELTAEREKILQYEQQMQRDLGQKRQELLGPILEEAREAVNAVAEENGYALVFDTSQFNTVLFAEESVDLMPLVKAKLGL